MLSKIFLGMSLIGAEWVLYFLILISVVSIGVIFERIQFYRSASKDLAQFRANLKQAAGEGKWDAAHKAAESRLKGQLATARDLEAELAVSIIGHFNKTSCKQVDVLTEIAQDSVVRTRIDWDRNLAILATVGSNAPFVGLFGTVLGIIKAFHDLSMQAASGGAQTVTAGISEALVATAVGILVAIPATVAYNLFQRKVKSAVAEAESLKSFLVGKLAS